MLNTLRLLVISLAISGLLCTAAGSIAASRGPDCSRVLTLGLHDHGLLYSTETGAGIDKDIADEMVRRSGCKINMTLLPRARIWQLIASGALDFSLSGIINEERDRFAEFAWYFSNKYYLLARKDSKALRLAEFEADTNLHLGVIRSFRYSEHANQFVDKLSSEQRVVYSTSLEPLYKLLMANRIQGMIIEPFDYPQLANSEIGDVTSIVDTNDPSIPHGLVMSRKSLSESEMLKWRELILEMRTDGTMLRIFEKYFKPDLAKTMVDF